MILVNLNFRAKNWDFRKSGSKGWVKKGEESLESRSEDEEERSRRDTEREVVEYMEQERPHQVPVVCKMMPCQDHLHYHLS